MSLADKDWKGYAITGMASMLFTGFCAWFVFGQGVLTITMHDKPSAHSRQAVVHENHKMRIEQLEAAYKSLPDQVADKVIARLGEVDSGNQ